MVITRTICLIVLVNLASPCVAEERHRVKSAQPWTEACRVRADHAQRIGGDVKIPVVVKRVEANYPASARARGASSARGIAIFELIVDTNGDVPCARVLKFTAVKPDREIYEAAQRALVQWKFKPATLHDEPVDVLMHLTQNF
jgi:outer membrane biosynthesis protein TonB